MITGAFACISIRGRNLLLFIHANLRVVSELKEHTGTLSLKADKHGTVFPHGHQMQLLMLALLAGHEKSIQLSPFSTDDGCQEMSQAVKTCSKMLRHQFFFIQTTRFMSLCRRKIAYDHRKQKSYYVLTVLLFTQECKGPFTHSGDFCRSNSMQFSSR